jgi:antitoxin component of RelBE/YafQ-DinJ toxin-antitoxin module
MSNTGLLQIRADSRILTQARKRASRLGYPSLQQIMRIFLNSFALGKVEPTVSAIKTEEQFPPEYIKLGPKATKRWENILRDADKEIKSGNYFATNSVDELMEYLEK